MMINIVHDLGANISKKQPLSRLLGDGLRSLMQQGVLEPGVQLPPEPEMAVALGVSRMTLRAALNILEREGTIVRRQGKGTFLTDQLLLANRLDLNLGVSENILSMGMKPGVKDIDARIMPASEQRSGQLDVAEGLDLIEVTRTHTANDKPVVFTLDILPYRLLGMGREALSLERFREILVVEVSLYDIFRSRLGLIVDYGVAKIRPAVADAVLAQRLGVSEGSVLMYVEQIDYDDAGTPLLLSYEYHVPDVYEFTVYRKR